MIRKLISRVLGHKDSATNDQPAILGVAQHGLERDHISRASQRTVQILQENGYQAYIVGGAVRDLLAGLKPKDFDVATDATPEQVRSCFRRSRIIGRRFQIVHVGMGNETIEVTTFRGHHGEQGNARAHIDDQGRVLRDNVFGSQAEDAARRDFTVNALYYDPTAETIVDYHHGVADLQQKTLRMIGDPRTRYREDPVRMLRAVRLAAKLGLSIDPEARRPIREMSELIENVPPSRLLDEMLKLLTSGHAVRCLAQLREEGLHHGLLPLLDVIFDQPLGERFVTLALETTDRRVREGRHISPGFLFATLLWHEVLSKWQQFEANGEPSIPALFRAMDEVVDVQAEKLAITRRIVGDIKEIWALQPRFAQRGGKRAYGVLQHPRFRAAYDFLLLRVESGELEPEVGEWWTAFLHASDDERAAMLLPPSAGATRKRRRRRRSAAADTQNGGDE
ncbi:polynucleotide adenylyltransferase PcnB [Accumulibacter sp.]|uniref:polynucleotide adenylyltransferase PcnB n=1 Tax=Accumulibacter sp. TaxID=2053492 RepID=UPI0025E014F6|nr:polynucleotide adenylyltransferase PcnB [Accumulibacter sp.]MCM8624796.1 polynucleotide adenylyltransferase PcnB [Accumulibacter sp.]